MNKQSLAWFSTERMQEEARQWTDDRLQMAIRRHDILPDAPEDLADREPRFSLAEMVAGYRPT